MSRHKTAARKAAPADKIAAAAPERDGRLTPPFKTGDVVRLKSGGKRMTVDSVERCDDCGAWQVNVAHSSVASEIVESTFDARMLELTPDDGSRGWQIAGPISVALAGARS